MSKAYRVGVLGAGGYVGADLVRLLLAHPEVEIVLLTANESPENNLADVFPHLGSEALPPLMAVDDVEWPALDLDIIFSSLPHAMSQDVIRGLFHATGHTILDELLIERREDIVSAVRRDIKVIDLSADFRLESAEAFEHWYGEPHTAPELQPAAVCGLPEIYRERLASAHLVACPDSLATPAILALRPLLAADAIGSADLILDVKTGISAGGRDAHPSLLFCERVEAAHPYDIGTHSAIPEIEQELSKAAKQVSLSFTPHMMPMSRGVLVTAYVSLKNGMSANDLRDIWDEQYQTDPFVRLLPEGLPPDMRQVRGSNFCVLNAFEDRLDGRAVVIAAIDNLVKGSGGQAVQAMNLMLGLDEATGLGQMPLFP